MKICIVTVYNSYNCGSYLQAKNLERALQPLGKISFLDFKVRKVLKSYFHKIRKTAETSRNLSYILRCAIFEMGELIRLRYWWMHLDTVSIESMNEHTDLVVLGSDEIWNISRSGCKHPIFWGKGIEVKKISYAPSINSATVNDFKDGKYTKYLDELSAISVRDSYSKEVLKNFCRKQIDIVLDPTLLYPPENTENFTFNKPYIAVYLFYGGISKEDQLAIIDFAKRRNLALVSAGQYIYWCNASIHSKKGNPFYIYQNADFVITNTFHGTAYAINYHKKFVSFSKDKNKILGLLESFELLDRVVLQPKLLEVQLERDINFEKVDELLRIYRRKSLAFIKQFVKTKDSIYSKR